MVVLSLAGTALLCLGCVVAWVGVGYERSRRLKGWFVGLFSAGVAASIYGTFFVVYRPSPTVEVHGIPFPVAVLQYESGAWVDYVGDAFLLNFLIVPAAFSLPAGVMILRRQWLRSIARIHRARRRPAYLAGRCPGCGYDLRQTAGRCPECGRAIPRRYTKSPGL